MSEQDELLLTNKEVVEDICGSCLMEDKWSDADCKVCQANMRASNKAQLAKVKQHYEQKGELQRRVTEYVQGVPNYPLGEGQLVSMVILHFNIPDKEAEIMVKKALEQKRLDRPELRKKIAWEITPVIKSYVLSYIHNLNQLETELKERVDYMTDQILALIPDIEEAKKQEIRDIANQIQTILAENQTWATLERSLVNFWQALKEGK